MAFVEDEVHALALLGGKLVHALAHGLAPLLLRQDLERAFFPGLKRFLQIYDVLVLRLAAADQRQQLEAGDAEQPSAELRFPPEPLRVAPHLMHRVYDNLLGFGRIPQPLKGKRVDRPAVRAVELPQSRLVTLAQPLQQDKDLLVAEFLTSTPLESLRRAEGFNLFEKGFHPQAPSYR